MSEKPTGPSQPEPGMPQYPALTPEDMVFSSVEQRRQAEAGISVGLDIALTMNADFVRHDEALNQDKLRLYVPDTNGRGTNVIDIISQTDEAGNRTAMLLLANSGRKSKKEIWADQWEFSDGPDRVPHLKPLAGDPEASTFVRQEKSDQDIADQGSLLAEYLVTGTPERLLQKRPVKAFLGKVASGMRGHPMIIEFSPEELAQMYPSPNPNSTSKANSDQPQLAPELEFKFETPDFIPDFDTLPPAPKDVEYDVPAPKSPRAESRAEHRSRASTESKTSPESEFETAEQEQSSRLRQAAGTLKIKFAEGYKAAKERTLTPENKDRLLQVGKNTISLAKVIMDKALDGKIQKGSRSSATEGTHKLQHLFDGLAASIDEKPVDFKQDKAAALEIIGKVAANILHDPSQRDQDGSKRLRSAEIAMELVLTAQDHQALRKKHKDPRVAASIAGLNAAARLLKTHQKRHKNN